MNELYNALPKITAEQVDAMIGRYDEKRINKTKLMKAYIELDRADILAVFEKRGWLSRPKKRDELIAYATDNGKTECTAWLLEFKRRTADLAAEKLAADKKPERELNADPNSVSELKKSWRYDKLDDGTLIILGYKGERSEIYVPRTIGKNIVTAIGSGAFSPLQMRITQERFQHRIDRITKITLPDTIKFIDPDAFKACRSLTEINIPLSVTDIGHQAFYDCEALEKLELSGGVKYIGKNAFGACPRLIVYVRRGSFAERYCKENGVKFLCKGE